jgi:kynurenine 3-monooxygenase
MSKLAIIGCGLAGPLAAIYLARRGIAVDLYERRPDLRKAAISAGRSINLALSARGIHALDRAGAWSAIREICIPMKGRMIHSLSGELTLQPYGQRPEEVIYSVSRRDLSIALVEAAGRLPGVDISFQHRCEGVELAESALRLHDESTGERFEVTTGPIIAADGSASVVRTEMLRTPRFDYSQRYLDYGYKELTIPAGASGGHVMETNALHIWPRGSFMLIALPNTDGTFACILFLPYEGDNSFASLRHPGDVVQLFETHFPDALPLMPDLTGNFFDKPIGSMITVQCHPWNIEGRALLLGDSAHAIVPFFGQGVNCAFEDCVHLAGLVDRHGSDWPVVFSNLSRTRKIDTDAIAAMALDNFIEMRDRVGHPEFLARKQMEQAIERRHPGVFVPKYSMVSFHGIPYSVAQARGEIPDRILDDFGNTNGEIDWARADALVSARLTRL